MPGERAQNPRMPLELFRRASSAPRLPAQGESMGSHAALPFRWPMYLS